MENNKFLSSEYRRLFSVIENLYYSLDPINDVELKQLLTYIQQRWRLDKDLVAQLDHVIGVLVRIAAERRINYDPNA